MREIFSLYLGLLEPRYIHEFDTLGNSLTIETPRLESHREGERGLENGGAPLLPQIGND